jgi:hypothetical protein
MQERRVTVPELALIAGTRGMLGVGIGLLVADRLHAHRRHTVGWTLLLIGAASTIPLALRLFLRRGNRGNSAASIMGG